MDLALDLVKEAEENDVELLLPVDFVVSPEFSESAKGTVVEEIPADQESLDIGPKTIELFVSKIADAKTVVWNGPMGVFEFPEFAKGTNAIAKALKEADATTIVGGGDSALAVEKAGYKDDITHVSTGGGASLELLEGKELPGIAAVEDK